MPLLAAAKEITLVLAGTRTLKLKIKISLGAKTQCKSWKNSVFTHVVVELDLVNCLFPSFEIVCHRESKLVYLGDTIGHISDNKLNFQKLNQKCVSCFRGVY